MRVLITGATGYLGTAMLEAIPVDVTAIPAGHTRGQLSVDITDVAAVAQAVTDHSPDVIVHLAAISETARAGADPETALSVNTAGARNVGAVAADKGIRLVALSSDVVFDGRAGPYREDSAPHPINPYGRSKLAGEEAVLSECGDGALVVRTSVLVGRDRADRHPFSTFVLKQAEAGQEIVLYGNERRSFYAVTQAARAVWECATGTLTGVLHIAATSSASRFEFGTRLIEAAGFDPSLGKSATGPADRPFDLTLDVGLAVSKLSTPMPSIDEVIAEVIADERRDR